MHCTTRFEGSEVDGDKSDAVDQLDHQLFGFGVVAGCKDDGTGFVGREVLYPGNWHVADRFNKPCANHHLSDYLAGCAPLQCSARSGHARQTNVRGLQMCVRRIDQDSSSPINALESVSYTDPMRGKNDDIALGSLLLRAGDRVGTEISDKNQPVSPDLWSLIRLWCDQQLTNGARTYTLPYRRLQIQLS
jgi:hypothetical protein